MDLVGDGFDVFSHMVDEFPARFSVKDNVGSPTGDEFVTMVIIVFIKNTGVDIWVLVKIIDECLYVAEFRRDGVVEILNGVHSFSPCWLNLNLPQSEIIVHIFFAIRRFYTANRGYARGLVLAIRLV